MSFEIGVIEDAILMRRAALDIHLHDGGGGGRRRIAHGQIHLHPVHLDRNRDDQHDQQHEHHVDQRRG
jgi:hypothetical protein